MDKSYAYKHNAYRYSGSKQVAENSIYTHTKS